MKIKPSKEFWKLVSQVSKDLEERAKKDPWLKERLKLTDRMSKTRRTHKTWSEDRDVYGHLGWYCARCSVDREEFAFMVEGRNAVFTCNQILAKKEK